MNIILCLVYAKGEISLARSDLSGRSFEYCVVMSLSSALEKAFPNRVSNTERAIVTQERHKILLEKISSTKRINYEKAAGAIAEWLMENKFGGSVEGVVIDQIPNSNGVRGDVTDIRMNINRASGDSILNLSLKHIHKDIKHPRLTRVPYWIDVVDPEKSKDYRSAYDKIWDDFMIKANELVPDSEKFKQLRDVDKDFVNRNLYYPFYNLVKNFLEENIEENEQVNSLFRFQVGIYSFIKIINMNGNIEIRDFSEIPSPTRVEFEYENGGYLFLHFDNDWSISMRLHTASSNISSRSIKFAVQAINLDKVVPPTHIQC